MEAVIDAITGLSSMLRSGFDAILGFFDDVAEVASMVGRAISAVPTFLSSILPESFIVIISVLLSVTLVYKIVGRD